MSDWTLIYSRQAQKDARRLARSGLKARARKLLDVIAEDPSPLRPATRRSSALWRDAIRGASTSSTVSSTKWSPTSTSCTCCGCGLTTSDPSTCCCCAAGLSSAAPGSRRFAERPLFGVVRSAEHGRSGVLAMVVVRQNADAAANRQPIAVVIAPPGRSSNNHHVCRWAGSRSQRSARRTLIE